MLKKIDDKRVLLIALILMLFISIPSVIAGDSSAMDATSSTSDALAVGDVASVDADLADTGSADSSAKISAADDDNMLNNSGGAIPKYASALDDDKLGDGGIWTISGSSETYTTLQSAIDASSSGDTITGSSGIDETISSTIKISKDLTISAVSSGDVILKGGSSGTVFNVSSGYTLTLNNIDFKDYYVSGTSIRGLALYNSANGVLNINNCNFENIKSSTTSYNYAMIYSLGTLNVDGCTFKDLYAYYGYALDIYGGTASIKNSVFSNISTGYSVTSIYVYSSGTTATVENCTFKDMTAKYAAIQTGSSARLILKDSTFKNLTNTGGSTFATGVYCYGSGEEISNCTFEDLTLSTSGNGAGVAISSGTYGSTNTNISGCSFINCIGTQTTSGNFISGAITTKGGTIYNNAFISNNATGTSGNAFNDILAFAKVTADSNYWGSNAGPGENSINSNNVTINNWAIITMDDVDSVFVDVETNLTFKLNTYNTTSGETGTISGSMADLSLPYTALLGNGGTLNIKDGEGTVSYTASSDGTETITLSTGDKFNFDVSADASSLIYVDGTSGTEAGPGTSENPYKTIAQALNVATAGKTIIIRSGTYTEKDLTVSADITIKAEKNAEVIIDAENNGRIFIITSDVILKDITLINGKTAGAGGAIYLNGGSLTANNINIYNSTAGAGGAIATSSDATSLNVSSSSFIDNGINADASSIIGGGAIYSNIAETSISSSTFTNNNANVNGANGGALYLANGANVTGNEINENSASLGNGGAVYIDSPNSVAVSGNQFNSNSAAAGGAIYINNGAVSLSENTIGTNTATSGKKIYVNGGTVNAVTTFLGGKTINAELGSTITLTATVTDDQNNEITGGTVTFIAGSTSLDPVAVSEGAATISYTIPADVEDDIAVSGAFSSGGTIVSGNIHPAISYWYIGENGYETLTQAVNAAVDGDVIIGKAGNYDVSGLTINKAITIKANEKDSIILDGQGARIFTIKANVELVNLVLRNGLTSANGGLITLNSGNLTVINTTFKDTQQASGSYSGVAIYIESGNSDLNIDGCEFSNLTGYRGTAIYHGNNGHAIINNTRFFNNTLRYDGGLISTYANLSIYNSNFTDMVNTVSSGLWGGIIYVQNAATANLIITGSLFKNIDCSKGDAIEFRGNKFNISHNIFDNVSASSSRFIIYNNQKTGNVNYNIFLNCDYYIYGGTASQINASYNYYGTNSKPSSSGFSLVTLSDWVILDLSAPSDTLYSGITYPITVGLTKYNTTSSEIYDLEGTMPDYTFELTATAGTINSSVTTVNGVATASYLSPNENLDEVIITANPGAATLKFAVMDTSSLVVVAENGSDITGDGTFENPYASIQEALNHVTESRNVVYVKSGTYKEHGIAVSKNVTIQGEDKATTIIDAEQAGNIFSISTDDITVNIAALTLTNGSAVNGGAIYAGAGQVNVYGNIISDSTASNGGAVYIDTNANIHDNTFTGLSGNGSVFFLNSGVLTYANNDLSSIETIPIAVSGGSLKTILTYVNGGTKGIEIGKRGNITATVTDVDGNKISGGTVEFILNGTSIANATVIDGVATFEIEAPEDSEPVLLTGTYSGDNDGIINTGKVKAIVISWFIGNDGYETLADAIAEAKDDDVIIGLPGTYNIDSATSINNNITIKANESGEIILHLNTTSARMFTVSGDKHLILENLILENGSTGSGSIVNVAANGTLTTDNCVFRNSGSYSSYAAVIYAVSNSDVIIKNTTFNNLIFTSSTSAQGAALYVSGGRLTVLDSEFTNLKGSSGGAIYIYNSNATIKNSIFDNNTASTSGGAIYTSSAGSAISNLLVNNCSFINSGAGTSGGAIYFGATKLEVYGSIFANCYVNTTSSYSGGGAIYTSANSTINYNVFINNTDKKTTHAGQDILLYSANKVANADYNYFGDNTKPDSTKVYAQTTSSTITLDKWVILDASINEIPLQGKNATLTVELSKYTDGTTNATLETYLKAIDIDIAALLGSADPVTVTLSEENQAAATVNYNADSIGDEIISFNAFGFTVAELPLTITPDASTTIFVNGTGNDLTGDGTQSNPYATIKEALLHVTDEKNIIYVADGTYTENGLAINKNVTIIGESANVIIDAEGNSNILNISEELEIALERLTLTNATVASGSGAIYTKSDIAITDVVISNVNGTAIYNDGARFDVIITFIDGSTLTALKGTEVTLNATVTTPEGYSIAGGTVSFTLNDIINGTAAVGDNGLATYTFTLSDDYVDYVVSGSYSGSGEETVNTGLLRAIQYNWFIGENGYEFLSDAVAAAADGDVITAEAGYSEVINNIQVEGKSITIKPSTEGKIILDGDNQYVPFTVSSDAGLTLIDIKLINGYSRSNGGLYVSGALTVINCTFENNTASSGSAIYLSNGANLLINGSSFIGNKGNGAVYQNGGNTIIDNSEFISNGNISSNSASVYLNSGNMTVLNTEFVNNTASRCADIFAYGSSSGIHVLIVDNCKFINSTSIGSSGPSAAAILSLYSTVSVNNSYFENCFNNLSSYSASMAAGAILSSTYGSNRELNVTNSVFVNCHAIATSTSTAGGAIVSAKAGNINYNIFINNTAGCRADYSGNDVSYAQNGNVNIDYNYWGINTPTVSTTTEVGNINGTLPSYWIVLDSGINETDVKLGSDYEVSAVFKVTDGTEETALEHSMPEYVIELSSESGTFEPAELSVSGETATATFTPTVVGAGTITIGDKEIPIAVTYDADYALISDINNVTVDLGVSTEITIDIVDSTGTASEGLDGETVTVTYNVDGTDYTATATVEGSTIKIDTKDLANLKAGSSTIANIAITKEGIKVIDKNITINVNQLATTLSADETVTVYVGSGSLEVTLLAGENPVEGKTISVKLTDEITLTGTTDANGVAIIDLSTIAADTYTAEISFAGDDEYIGSSTSSTITVNKYATSISAEEAITVEYGEGSLDITLSSALGPVEGKTIVLKVNDEINLTAVTDSNGVASIDLSTLAADTYTAEISFAGDDKYLGSDGNVKITVNKPPKTSEELQKMIDETPEGGVLNLSNMEFADISDVNITKDIAIVGDNVTIATAGNGSPVFNVASNISNVSISGVEFIANNGDVLVKASAVNGTDDLSIVNPAIELVNNTVTPANENVVASSITLLELETERGVLAPSNPISIKDNNLPEGVKAFDFAIAGLNNGSDVNIPQGGNINTNKTAPTVKTATAITAKAAKTTTVNKKINGKKAGKNYSITLKDSKGNVLAGKQVLISFNGKIYKRTTNAKGVATVKIALSKKGTYPVVVSFLGDENYNGSFAVAKVKVKPQKVKITVAKKKYKARKKTKVLTAKLKATNKKAIKGKKLVFTVNGKKYTAKTNKKGVAKVKVKLSRKKTYKVKVKFAGDNTFKKATKKGKVKIV